MNKEYIENISELYRELLKIEKTTNKIFLESKKISIIFHKEFKIDIVFNDIIGIYYIYINSIFLCDIEEQDVLEFLIEIINNSVIIQYKKTLPFKKQLKIVPKKPYDLKNWKKKRNILIFTSEKTIVDNF